MSNTFNRAFSDACDDFFKSELLDLSHMEKDSVPEQTLTDDEIALLSRKILALPPEESHVLYFRYCFHSSLKDTANILNVEQPRETLYYTLDMLSYFMGLSEMRIADDSMEKACNAALSEYTADEHFDVLIRPKYSREFRRKLKEIKAAQSNIRTIIAKQVAAAAIICVVCFGAALTANADLRERFLNWVVETFPKFSIFVPAESSSPAESYLLNFSDLSIGYIPDGFELHEKTEMPSSLTYEFINTRDNNIIISISDPTKFYFDTEDVKIQEISFKNATACHWTRDGITYFLWQQDGFTCYIISKLSVEKVIKIAQNVE